MDKWEYLSIKIYWDSQQHKWMVVGKSAGGKESIHELLNPYGLQGWELIAFTPTYLSEDGKYTYGVTIYTVTHWDIDAFRALFKRRLS